MVGAGTVIGPAGSFLGNAPAVRAGRRSRCCPPSAPAASVRRPAARRHRTRGSWPERPGGALGAAGSWAFRPRDVRRTHAGGVWAQRHAPWRGADASRRVPRPHRVGKCSATETAGYPSGRSVAAAAQQASASTMVTTALCSDIVTPTSSRGPRPLSWLQSSVRMWRDGERTAEPWQRLADNDHRARVADTGFEPFPPTAAWRHQDTRPGGGAAGAAVRAVRAH